MKRGKIDLFAFRLEMPTPERTLCVLRGERHRGGANVRLVGVIDHRTLAGRVLDQALGDTQLQHARLRGSVRGRLGKRVPTTESHTPRVASRRCQASCPTA